MNILNIYLLLNKFNVSSIMSHNEPFKNKVHYVESLEVNAYNSDEFCLLPGQHTLDNLLTHCMQATCVDVRTMKG